jgi:hypothetical protein
VLEVETSAFLALAYLTSTTFAMGFGLLCLTIGSFSLMFGQGRALRGAEGLNSLDQAIEQLKSKAYQSFSYFALQLLFFHLSSFLLMWCYYRFLVALVINGVLGMFLLMFVRNGWEIIGALWIDEKEAVSGKFKQFGDVVGGELDGRRREK